MDLGIVDLALFIGFVVTLVVGYKLLGVSKTSPESPSAQANTT